MKPGPKPVKSGKLEAAGTDVVVALIVDGTTYREIAKAYGVAPSTLVAWIESNSERSRACARAREASAQMFDEQAEHAIRSARTPLQLARARELAIHLRWRAKSANPRRYGEKVAVESKVSVQEISDDQLVAELAKFGIHAPVLNNSSNTQLLFEDAPVLRLPPVPLRVG